MDGGGAQRWAAAFLDAAEREATALGDLDREAGDGDFGTNLTGSIRAARATLAEAPAQRPADAFTALSGAFMASGGTSGPLYGMWFRELANAAGDADAIGTPELAAGFERGLQTVQRLGGAEVGDKTMIDAMAPATEALAAQAAAGAGVRDALAVAARAARAGAEATAGLVARRGRASYVGEAARGVVDPGAATVAILLESASIDHVRSPIGKARRMKVVGMVRADNLGSLLRPDYLLEARAADLPPHELRAVEDRAVDEAILLQEDVGLPIVTDGEYRRRFFFSTVEVLVDGIDGQGFVRHHRDDDGVQHELRTPTPVARLTRKSTLAEYELDYVRPRTQKLVKVTMPSPSLLVNYWSDGRSETAYTDREAYREHLIELMNEDVKALAAHGADHIQLDCPHYAYIQKFIPSEDRNATLAKLIEADNKVFEGVSGVVTGLHVCRGNDRSHFTGTEPYDDFAAAIFPNTAATRLLLEYDDERSGGFAPLRHIREDQEVVLGLVTTKRDDMESADELKARIDDAAQYVPLERLALSTQCGFGSNAEGNAISRDAERAKLELVVSVATDVWGHA